MGTLATGGAADALIRRLERLEPLSRRRWGSLSAHEMLCHLSDSFRATMGERPCVPRESWFTRTVIRWVALHTPIPWPRGVQTMPEVDPRRQGSKPEDFESDRRDVVSLIRRFGAPDVRYDRHPVLGTLSRQEWLTWAYRHVDHHVRQFGL
jgi:hypothetical protein